MQEEYKFTAKYGIGDLVENVCTGVEGIIIDIHFSVFDSSIKYQCSFPSTVDTGGFTRDLYSEIEISTTEDKQKTGFIK